MRKAIKDHLGDFIAMIALFAIAIGIGGYILSNQRLRFPFVQEETFNVKVELPDAQAVIPGQGQTVRVAGVRIGDIGQVELEEGKAVVTLQIDPEHKKTIRRDATALLRTRTGLKDMFIEIDPGNGEPLASNARIPVNNTAPDIDPDEFLSALDRDTRDYLRLLVSGAGKGLKGRGSDLQETFARLGPIHRDLARVTKAAANRRANLRRLINRYGLLVETLGDNDDDLARLVQGSNDSLGAFAEEEVNLSSFVRQLPGSLRETERTLGKVDTLSKELAPALDSIRPAFRKLDATNAAVRPLAKEGTPILRDQVRPFARIGAPYTRDIGEGAKNLATAAPDLAKSFRGLNRLFNIGAYNPGGTEGLTGNLSQDRARNEGYLYWLAWVAHNTTSLFNIQDAQGPFRRVTLGGANCGIVEGLLVDEGAPPAVAAASVGLLKSIGACS